MWRCTTTTVTPTSSGSTGVTTSTSLTPAGGTRPAAASRPTRVSSTLTTHTQRQATWCSRWSLSLTTNVLCITRPTAIRIRRLARTTGLWTAWASNSQGRPCTRRRTKATGITTTARKTSTATKCKTTSTSHPCMTLSSTHTCTASTRATCARR